MFFLLFNAEEIITTYLGLAYKDSAIIFSVFNLTLLMRVTSYQDVLISANKSSTILIYNLAVFVMNLLLNIILIDYLGMIGAAISTVICLMVYAVALLQRNMKELHSNLLDAIHLKS